MQRWIVAGPVVVLATLLAACGEGQNGGADAQPGGQVLEGTISDAMIPLDLIHSQGPLEPRVVETAEGGEAGQAGEDGETPGPDTSAEQAGPADDRSPPAAAAP